MAVYRYQVVCVGMWRGKIKRWNTTFHSNSNTRTAEIKTAMGALGYKLDGDVVGACSGGVASITMYNAAGGAPVSQTIYFDWQQPGTWIPYTGEAWASVPAGTPLDASGESAMVAMAKMPSLSSTGKPVFLRKYFHAIPSRQAADYSSPDISPTLATAIASKLPGTASWANSKGVVAAAPVVEPYYLNHQRVRGRRRTARQVAAQSFSAGVVAGAGANADGAAPFQAR